MSKVEKVFELSEHATGIYDLSIGLEKNKILTASGDSFIASWNVKDRKPDEFSVKAEGGCYSVRFIPEQDLLWVGRVNGDIHVIDTASKQEVKHFKLHKKGVFSIAYLPYKNWVLTGGGDGVLAVWDLDQMKLLRSIQLSDKKLRKIVLHEEQKKVAVGASNGLVYMLETELFNSLETLRADPSVVSALAFHPTKPVLMSGGKNAHIKAWKLTSEESELMINAPIHKEIMYDIVFSPDNRYYATCSRDKTVKIWDAQTTDLVEKIDRKVGGHNRSVNTLFWMEFDNLLISAGDDAKVMGWRVKD